MQPIEEAFIIAIPPPPVRGLGNSGGFKLQLQDRTGDDVRRVLAAAYQLMGQARQNPNLAGVFTTFSANSPQVYLEIDREKASILNVPIANIFETLQVNLGTAYVNDFNAFGRVYQVRAQADQRFRIDQDDINRLRVRSSTGALVPARHARRDPRGVRARPHPALQHVHVGAAAGQRGARRLLGRRRSTPWSSSPARACRPAWASSGPNSPSRSAQTGNTAIFIFAPVGALRLPRARGPVRELVAAARHHPDRADVRALGARRRDAARAWTTTS